LSNASLINSKTSVKIISAIQHNIRFFHPVFYIVLDKRLLRYSRQIFLPEIGIEGQQTLLDSTLLLIGVGGLGAPNALCLAASGIGHLIIADFDQVELSNLARQVIHHTNDIGKDKVAK
jgi:molybdopterin/thiamine biosynthesis adenylyltransferase